MERTRSAANDDVGIFFLDGLADHSIALLKYGGDVSIEQYNFAGIGATGNGAKGNSFENVQTGIRAQVQHLKAYASTEDLVHNVVDPRFQYVTRGICPYVEWLGINENPQHVGWATAVGYGNNIVERISTLKSF
ncbi:MAG: glucosaminidase domain-containing protein [Lachnospiraceae bacterium]|nr:glucosaminidase domain-containing protein [Lachnospiraceae bacterium]